ncbi:MAG: right-handed parallel beta-helix repeat-containing protein [Thermodesulfovibrionales bacterium]
MKITKSGSYQLQTNFAITNANTTAILVTADNVTIDLNGFAIIGPNVCSGVPLVCNNNGTGIGIDAWGKQNIKVYNGTIRGMGNVGIQTGGGSIIESVRVVSNGGYGINVNGSGTVSGNTVNDNGTVGIYVFGSSTVSGNAVTGNGHSGIILVYGTVSGNAVAGNGGDGIALGASAGYFNNVLNNNTGGDVGGGVNLGHNLCTGVLCPP